jgi:hypothetical protein
MTFNVRRSRFDVQCSTFGVHSAFDVFGGAARVNDERRTTNDEHRTTNAEPRTTNVPRS